MATPHFLHLLGRAVWATHANCEAASWPGERHRACRLALQWSGCRHGCIAQARRFHEAGCACRSGLVAGVIAVGSVIGPVLLMFGLAQTSASTVATALIAWFVSARISYRVLLVIVLPCCRCHGAVLLGSADTIQAPPAAIIEARLAWEERCVGDLIHPSALVLIEVISEHRNGGTCGGRSCSFGLRHRF